MYVALFLFLIFYDPLEAVIPLGNYWDELALFFVLCWGCRSLWQDPHMRKRERQNWPILLGLVAIGVLGNLCHPGLQDHKIAILKDVVAFCKFPVIFFLLRRRTNSAGQEARIAAIARVSRYLILVTLVAVAAGWFVDLGFYTGEVRIIPAFAFIFSHPTFFISSYVMIAAALMAESVDRNWLFLVMDCLLLFMAQRSKGYIFIVFLVLIILLGESRVTKVLALFFGTQKEQVKPGRVMLAVSIICFAVLLVGKSRIENILKFGLAIPRTALHVVGLQIMLDHFPLGSGFGTFASYLSGRYYSNIYALYGIANVEGMMENQYNFISDVFWPYIYGQFGVFGLLLYARVIFRIFIQQFRTRLPDASRLAMVTVWIYALIASTSEAYFTNGTGVQMALFLTLFIGYGQRQDAPEQTAA